MKSHRPCKTQPNAGNTGNGESTKKYPCNICGQEKPQDSFYHSKRNRRGLEHICKVCKSIQSASRRYNVSSSVIENLYQHKNCMCCHINFTRKKLRHIHHVNNTVCGIICFSCNHILGQETKVDKQRIEACLDFISRNNLSSTVNPQERPISKEAVPESSETTCCETLHCKQCKRPNLKLTDFHKTGKFRQPRRVCKDCWNASWRLRNKFVSRRKKATKCECCGHQFTKTNKSCVHHIGETVHGIVCNRCNTVLGNETQARVQQLKFCLEFMI